MTKAPLYKRRIFWMALSTFFVLVAAAGLYLYMRVVKTEIYILNEANSRHFYIKSADTYPQVLANLVREGFVKDEELFDFLAKRANLPNKIKPGRYTLKKGETYIDAIRLLRSGKQDEVKLVINPMITARQLAGLAGRTLETDSIALVNMLEDSVYLAKFGFVPKTALCLFIPDTYNFYWNTDADGFMQRMKKEYDRFWNGKRKIQADAVGLTHTEVSILASIVDGETNKVDEMGVVAGLYLNRLKKGMLLQADPTVKYAARNMGLQRVYKYHTQIESPYNTYLYTGLPPGPLALPSQQAIQAVLTPSKHNFIYMCAKEDLSGYHNFTDNLTQHNLNADRYRLELDKRGIQ